MTSRRIINDQRCVHFVTFSVDRRRRLLDHNRSKKILLGVLNQELNHFHGKCPGYVVMPDHVHALIWLQERGQLSQFMHAWKRKSSFHIRNWYRERANQYFNDFGQGHRFWQPKYYPFAIESRRKLEEKLTYMHHNPVKAGFVERAIDWQWSSARWYLQQKSVGVPIEWVECD